MSQDQDKNRLINRPENRPQPGVPMELQPGVRLILADNPSPMTFWGTNTYLLGEREITVVDPGPDDPAHLQAILAATSGGKQITRIIATHSHNDHSQLAESLKAATGAPVLAFGDSEAGRSPVMQKLAAMGDLGRDKGVHDGFAPDQCIVHGEVLSIEDQELKILHTPGHMGNHITLALGDAAFTGDHVMGWASSMVSPPEGDLTDFMASCEMLAETQWRVFHSAHGAPISDPNERLNWLLTHRRAREAEICATLSKGPATIRSVSEAIYHDVNPKLLFAAERNVLSHIVDLMGRDVVQPQQAFDINATFELI